MTRLAVWAPPEAYLRWLRGRFSELALRRLLASPEWADLLLEGKQVGWSMLIQQVLEQEAQEFLDGAGSTDETRITSTAVPVFHF